MKKKIKYWIEAMRLRTLPVSLAGVVMAIGYGRLYDCLDITVAIICLLFATLAQIASNFANEYFDFRDGLDRPGREGPRRGVTEGDITPQAMFIATLATLAAACLLGLSLIFFGPWWLILLGLAIAAGVFAYSAGPYPLSRHGLGELMVILFFGLIPVSVTFFLMSGSWPLPVILGSLATGLLGANVLIVNNYRDYPDDKAVGKRTLAVIIGASSMPWLYLLNGLIALYLLYPTWDLVGTPGWIVAILYFIGLTILFFSIVRRSGRALNPFLGLTAMLMAALAIAFAIVA